MATKVKAKKAAKKPPIKAKKIAPVKAQRRGRSSTSRISSKHQVTIPVEVLRQLNLEIGDQVEFHISDQEILQVKKVAPVNAFAAFTDSLGDSLEGFDLAKEREESWG